MTFIGAEILQEMTGPAIASGPAGRHIFYEVKDGANIDATTGAVTAKLNEQSLAAARAKIGDDGKEQHAKNGSPQSRPGRAPSFMASSEHADGLFDGMIKKRGLQTAVEKSIFVPPVANRLNHRTAMSEGMVSKGSLNRIEQRRKLRLRATFDKIAQQKQKPVIINPQNMPAPVIEKMVVAAINTGAQMTPLGPVVQAMKKVGYNPKEWARWEHALIGVISGPRPREY